MEKKWNANAEQIDIFSEIRTSRRNLRIDARAGTGKTTTIVHGLKYIPSHKRVLFLAYNKHIVLELEDRVPRNVKVKTCHGFGLWTLYKAIRPGGSKPNIVHGKVGKIIERLIEPTPDPKTGRKRIANFVEIREAVSLAKNYLIDDMDKMLDVIDRFDLVPTGDPSAMETLASQALVVLEASNADPEDIDFDDMIYLPILRDLEVPKFDITFVDETQDLNLAQMELVKKVGGRVIVVGDPHQAIYAFRGADSHAMDRLSKMFKTHSLPLTTTYRCPQLIVSMAQRLVSDIMAAPKAPPGITRNISEDDLATEVRPGDMVLCRTNAPLVGAYFDLIARGVKATIRGRNLGPGLLKMIDKMGATELSELPQLLLDFCNEQVRELLAENKTIKAQLVQDKVDTLLVLCRRCKTLEELEDTVDHMFNDDEVAGVILSTVHRAKGLEANRVFILHPNLVPHRMSTQPWEIDQEFNLAYVAITRAKEELIFVYEPKVMAAGATPDWAALPDPATVLKAVQAAHPSFTKKVGSVVQDNGEDDVELEEPPEEFRRVVNGPPMPDEMPDTFDDNEY